jgi:hypothetical protein
MKTKLLVILLAILANFAITQQAFAQRKLANNSGKPFPIMSIRDSQGVVFAKLYISVGKEMTLGFTGDPIAGAGFYEAVTNNYYYVPFEKGGFGGLHVDKIEWDDQGKLISIKNLRPFFEGSKQIAITSDVKEPKIKDGILYLKLDGKGDTEFKFNTLFGKGVSIEPPIDSK